MISKPKSTWSSFGKAYNANAARPITYQGIKKCFDFKIFPLLDSVFEKTKEPVKIFGLACGTGAEYSVLFDHYGIDLLRGKTEILATDFAEGMVEVTNDLFKDLKVDFGKAQKMDAQDLSPLGDSSQDIVLFPFGPMIVPDANASLKEILRTLKPNGLGVFITPSTLEFYDILDATKKQILKARGLTPPKEGDPAWSFYENRAVREWGTAEKARKHLEEAGFEDEKIGSVLVEVNLIIEDWKAFSLSLRFNPGMGYFWNDLTENEGEAFWNNINKTLLERYGDGGRAEMKQEVVLSWAEK